MSQIFVAFGIDWRLLIIDTINFGLALLVLWYFLYTPLLGMIEKRQKKVAQGVIDAENANQKLKEIEASRAGVLASAGHEADEVLSRARKAASDKERELMAAGEVAAARMLKDAEVQAQDLKQKALAESKQEVAKLIVLGMERTSATHK